MNDGSWTVWIGCPMQPPYFMSIEKMTRILMRSIRMKVNWFVQPMELSQIVNLIINYLVRIYHFTDSLHKIFAWTSCSNIFFSLMFSFLIRFSFIFLLYIYSTHKTHMRTQYIADKMFESKKYSWNENKNIHENWNGKEIILWQFVPLNCIWNHIPSNKRVDYFKAFESNGSFCGGSVSISQWYFN